MPDNGPSARYKSRLETGSRRQRKRASVDRSSTLANNVLAYYESSSPNSNGSQRPATPESPFPVRRKLSAASNSSSSDYSEDSDSLDEPFSDLDAAVTRKRSTMPSQGGADRRRLAIVQMETLHEALNTSGTNSSASSLRSRRGLSTNLAGLALVAPPDASAKSYTQLTPPQAQLGHHHPDKLTARDFGKEHTEMDKGRHPTGNNTPVFQPSTRLATSYEQAMLSPPSYAGHHSALSSAFSTPLITTPDIGASKEIHVPVAAPVVIDLASKNAVQTRPHISAPKLKSTLETPSITASPAPFSPIETSGFVHYQPGIHAIAGPLPPPPRLFDVSLRTPPPPRPPRLHSPAPPRPRADLEAVKQALQLPASVTAKLAKSSPLVDIKTLETGLKREEPPPRSPNLGDGDAASGDLCRTPSAHKREGAFQVSPTVQNAEPNLNVSTSSSEYADSASSDLGEGTDQLPDDGNGVPTVTVVEEEEAPKSPVPADIPEEHIAEASPSSLASSLSKSTDTDGVSSIEAHSPRNQTASPDSSSQGGISLSDSVSRSGSLSPRSSAMAPSPPPKSFRHSLTTSLKRFSSLSGAPSLSARSKRSSSGTHRSSRTPSPSVVTRRIRRKIVDGNPSAMFCHEVYQQRTTAERCAIYTAKINELYSCDCGLSDWVVEMKYRSSTHPARGPSSKPFVPQPRHTSRSSMISEATFPRRPDASTATDLSSQSSTYHDASPISVPVSLPYQALANQQRQQSIRSTSSAASGGSVRSLAPSATTTASSRTTGFFASLGRKASLTPSSRRERAGLSMNPAATARHVLAKPPPTTKDISKPILMAAPNHSAPHGPRALSSSLRVQRSQTLMMPSATRPIVERDEVLGRRPSLFNISDGNEVLDIRPDPEFEAQVEKLSNLLPHADRVVLAGYLRRAGQDVLAIGQYLEDEKNGTLKYF